MRPRYIWISFSILYLLVVQETSYFPVWGRPFQKDPFNLTSVWVTCCCCNHHQTSSGLNNANLFYYSSGDRKSKNLCYVDRAGSFWRVQGRILSLPFPASTGCLGIPWLLVTSLQTLLFPPLTTFLHPSCQYLVITFWVHPDNPV